MNKKTAVNVKDFVLTAVFFSLAGIGLWTNSMVESKTTVQPILTNPEPICKKTYIPERKRLNINTAPRGELVKIPGIGPVMSKKIVDYRQKKPFSDITDLTGVNGIGKEKLKKISPYIIIKKAYS